MKKNQNVITRLLATSVLLLGLTTTSSYAFFGDDEARRAILDLRVQVKALEDQYQQLTTLASRNQLTQVSQHEQYQRELGIIKSQLEVIDKRINDLETSQKTFYLDLDQRLRHLEGSKINTAASTTKQDKQWDNIQTLIDKEAFEQALPKLESYVAQTPSEPAYLALLRTQIATKKYPEAIRSAQLLLKQWPKSESNAETLLMLAVAQLGQEQQSQAEQTLEKIIKDYPSTPSASIAKKHLNALKK